MCTCLCIQEKSVDGGWRGRHVRERNSKPLNSEFEGTPNAFLHFDGLVNPWTQDITGMRRV